MADSVMPVRCGASGRGAGARLRSAVTTVVRSVTVAAGVFAPGHLGELTRQVPFELVDAVLEQTRATERRLRTLPSRVGVYFVLALALFPGLGAGKVWTSLLAGLGPGLRVSVSDKALRDSAPPHRRGPDAGLVRSVGRAGGAAIDPGRAVRPVPDGGLRRVRVDQGARHRPQPVLAGQAEGLARGHRLPGGAADDPGRDRHPGPAGRGVRAALHRRNRLRTCTVATAEQGHAGADRPRLRRRSLSRRPGRHRRPVPGPDPLDPETVGADRPA